MLRSIKRKLQQDPDFSHDFHQHHEGRSLSPAPDHTSRCNNDTHNKDCQPRRPVSIAHLVSHCPVSIGACNSTTTSRPSTKSEAASLSQQPRTTTEAVRGEKTTRKVSSSTPTTLLLARPNDSAILSPLHVFIRKQIEVFTVTEKEILQPSPGRKKPIKLNQVGLRCIHCKSSKQDRVKRAVCYPTSVGRVYHCVSDMKFDHFNNCHELSQVLKKEFEQLKKDQQSLVGSNKARFTCSSDKVGSSSSSTAQYYHDSAFEMGLIDDGGAVYISSSPSTNVDTQQYVQPPVAIVAQTQNKRQRNHLPTSSLQHTFSINKDRKLLPGIVMPSRNNRLAAFTHQQLYNNMHLRLPPSIIPPIQSPASSLSQLKTHPSSHQTQLHCQQSVLTPSSSLVMLPLQDACPLKKIENNNDNRCPLYLSSNSTMKVVTLAYCQELDQQHLNPLHCFVRRHIEVFVANENDTVVPAPGRKNRVVLGQVGLRCVHCAKHFTSNNNNSNSDYNNSKNNAKKQKTVKAKRAVCYPPSISAIYHSVSNMKFDHFGICQSLPPNDKEEFERLRLSCNRRRRNSSSPPTSSSTNKSKSPIMANSTAQYYHDSAIRLGLIDTEQGIRFRYSRVSAPISSSSSESASSSTTVTTENFPSRRSLLTQQQQQKQRRSSSFSSGSSFSSSSESNIDEMPLSVFAATNPYIRAAYDEIRRSKPLLVMHDHQEPEKQKLLLQSF